MWWWLCFCKMWIVMKKLSTAKRHNMNGTNLQVTRLSPMLFLVANKLGTKWWGSMNQKRILAGKEFSRHTSLFVTLDQDSLTFQTSTYTGIAYSSCSMSSCDRLTFAIITNGIDIWLEAIRSISETCAPEHVRLIIIISTRRFRIWLLVYLTGDEKG